MLTQKRLKELFNYDAETGNLIRKVSIKGTRARKGSIAGGKNTVGYIQTRIDSEIYLNHRLVWLYHNGYTPESGIHIDHIDRDRANNRIENLREVSHVCNLRNTGNRKNNSSGVKGVYWFKRDNKWHAQIVVAGKDKYLGMYDDFTDAVAARLAAEQSLNWSGCDSSSPSYEYMQAYLTNLLYTRSNKTNSTEVI